MAKDQNSLRASLAAVHARIMAAANEAQPTEEELREQALSARVVASLRAMGYSDYQILAALDPEADGEDFENEELDLQEDIDIPAEEVVTATINTLRAMGEHISGEDDDNGGETLTEDDVDQVGEILDASIKAANTTAAQKKLQVRLTAALNSLSIKQFQSE